MHLLWFHLYFFTFFWVLYIYFEFWIFLNWNAPWIRIHFNCRLLKFIKRCFNAFIQTMVLFWFAYYHEIYETWTGSWKYEANNYDVVLWSLATGWSSGILFRLRTTHHKSDSPLPLNAKYRWCCAGREPNCKCC